MCRWVGAGAGSSPQGQHRSHMQRASASLLAFRAMLASQAHALACGRCCCCHQDFTAHIKRHPDLEKACISNPSIAALHPAPLQHPLPAPAETPAWDVQQGAHRDCPPGGDATETTTAASPGLLVLAYRIYTSVWGTPCVAPELDGGQWAEGWKGSGGLGVAVSASVGVGGVFCVRAEG